MDRIDHANEWLKYARSDIEAAHILSNHHPSPIEIICFHCQQCGEKALKSILAYYDEIIPRTHNLNEVLSLCSGHYSDMSEKFTIQADHLTAYAVVTRYPNEVEVTEADMTLAIKYAKEILTHCEALING